MMWHCVWWCDTLYDDVTLCVMMWHCIWWCDTLYDDVTLCRMMWHCVWWCDTMYDDVTLCMMMWHCKWCCDTLLDDVTLCMMMWHCVWWCDTMYDDVTLCMMTWHCTWWCDSKLQRKSTSQNTNAPPPVNTSEWLRKVSVTPADVAPEDLFFYRYYPFFFYKKRSLTWRLRISFCTGNLLQKDFLA